MRWRRNLRLSLRALRRSPWRTALSVLGIAIGIAAVVVLLGAGAGAERALQAALEELGRNLLVVRPEQRAAGALRGVSRAAETLTLGDREAIDRQVPGVLRTAPVAGSPVLARAAGRTLPVTLVGTTPSFRQLRNFPLASGRFFDDDDVAHRRRVIVIGDLLVDELFRGEWPLGETLFLDDIPFRIIGVTRKKGVSFEATNEDELIFTPVTTAMRRLLNVEFINRLYIQAASEELLPAVRSRTERLLRERHEARSGAGDDFDLHDQTAMLRAQRRSRGSLSRLVNGLAALALVLGGVGLLAVSLLSVRERYAEIGLRLAVGGLPRDLLLQFLTETTALSALGGMLGLGLGVGGIRLGSAVSRWPMVLSWQSMLYPLCISVAIALIFGAYPALRAARLDPITALHSR